MILKHALTTITLLASLFLSGCSEEPKPVKQKPKLIQKPIVKEVLVEPIKEVDLNLTPIQLCEKEDGKFNLIVNTPEGAKVRILNIKPKYYDCMALVEARYFIEVSKKGYMLHKEWIKLDEDMEVYVSLIEYLDGYMPAKVTGKMAFRTLDYNANKIKKFIKKYPKSSKIKVAKKRLELIENEFYGYSPKNKISYSGCSGFYPKKLSEDMLLRPMRFKNWKSIRWAGSCKNKLFNGRGTLYFEAKNSLHVELKGKMINGFFQGNVYNNSSAKKKPSLIKGTGFGKFNVKLNTKEDFKNYQN